MKNKLLPVSLRLGLSLIFAFSLSSLRANDVISAGASWRYFKGLSPASAPDTAAWRELNFGDATWASGPTPFYFGEPFAGTELTDMSGRYTSVFLRKTFTVTDPGKVGELLLTALSDDGFIAWINGKEVARYNVPEGELAHTATALGPLPEPLPFEIYAVAKPWETLRAGENVLAIHAFNSSLTGSDFVIDARLSAVIDTIAPTLIETIPPAGATVDQLTFVEVFFSEPVQGIGAGDLLVNGAPAATLSQLAPGHYVFTFQAPLAGSVKFEWRAGHSITDVLGQGNVFVGGIWSLTFDPSVARKSVMITEFMADDDKTLLDDDCDQSDWIEIHNAGDTPVNLLGWSLTDDSRLLGKWRFPDYTLTPGAYMVVFASQKNKTILPARVGPGCRTRTNARVGFHTNFKLDDKGEYLALVAPDGQVVSAFGERFPPQRRDVSYGRVAGAPDKLGFFERPTPGAMNADTGAGFTPPVEFSRASGTFVQGLRLQLSCADATAVVRYTLDGTFPAETNRNLMTYTGSLIVTNTVQVRARAFAPGLLPSTPTSATYLALTNNPVQLAGFTSSLPILVMTTLKTAVIGSTRNTAVHFSLFEPENGLTSLRSRPTFTTRGGTKTRGSSTSGQPQSNFAIEWWDEFDQDKDLPVLGMPEDSEWVLYAPNGFDPPLIHNSFTMALSQQMNSAAPRTRFVEVYRNAGGPLASNQWFGLYVLMEKPGLSKSRIDFPKAQPEDIEIPEVTGSYLFKTDRADETGGDTGFTAGGSSENRYVEPKEIEMKAPQRAPQLAYLKKYFADLDLALRATNPNWRDPVVGYRAYVDLTNWVDFHILETLSGQVDAIRLSTYFYKPREGKLQYGPRWDYDRAWESKDDSRDDNPRVWDTGGGLFGPPWWNRVLADRDAWQLWIDRWQMFRQGPLSRSNMFSVIDRMTNEVRRIQPRQAQRWRESAPRGSYSNEIRIMKTWISNRLDWIDSRMAQPPTLSSTGGVVTPGFKLTIQSPARVSNPTNATVIFTLDGSDPRPIGGTNVVTAFTNSGPITITTNTRVVARTRDNGRTQTGGPLTTTPWSSPVAATFIVTPPPLVVTELMFHPEPPPPGSPYAASDFEFLELENVSAATVDLVGYHFTAGISFRFTATSAITRLAPGARVLLVRNQAAFLTRYPGATRIAGQYAGSLADEGERLTLVGPVEEPIFDFVYGDGWRKLADGFGFSLVLADEATSPADLSDADRWRLSAAPGGSPGFLDPPPPPAAPRVRINEALTFAPVGQSDWIELFNPENVQADVSGWWLTDDLDTPKKVRLPADTRVGAGGYGIVSNKVFDPADNSGFGLSSEGDGVWLFSADAEGNLTGWFHGFEFGAAERGISFGRHLSSDGREHFVAQSTVSPAAVNKLPLVGSATLSEVMFAPLPFGSDENKRDEFIEIRNVTGQALALFDFGTPTNTWQLRGAVEIDFPPNIVLSSGGHLVVVSFHPTMEPLTLTAFRARYGMDAAAPVLGPWQGALNNAGESIRLLRPGQPAGHDTPRGPYLLVDQIDYSPSAPWPEGTVNTGLSLSRRDHAAFGNDPMNWYAGTPTPGESDADHDGLPDSWELSQGLNATDPSANSGPEGDPDGDGFTNWHEFLNRTDPRQATSALSLRASLREDGVMSLTFVAPPGRSFTLETRASLTEGTWQTVRSLVSPVDGITQTTEGVTEAARYFRVLAK